jgi:hypothetical protein
MLEWLVIAATIHTAHPVSNTFVSAIATLVVWIVADMLRRLALPTIYFGGGFFDLLGKRFFWAYGPQLIACLGMWFAVLVYLPPSSKISNIERATEAHSDRGDVNRSSSNVINGTSEINQSPTEDCGRPYPCRISEIIDYSDWQSVLSALAFGMQEDVSTKIMWDSVASKHSGYVQRVDQSLPSDPGCRVFEIAGYVKDTVQTATVTACRTPTGAIEVK